MKEEDDIGVVVLCVGFLLTLVLAIVGYVVRFGVPLLVIYAILKYVVGVDFSFITN